MFERVVVGIDPGMAATGLGALGERRGASPQVLVALTIRTSPGDAEAERLRVLHDSVSALLHEHGPSAVAVERLLWGRNVGSAMGVARASGVILLAAAEAGAPVHEYAPLEVKMAVTGSGSARKEDVRRALERLHGISDVPAEPDAADALAVALCHLHQARIPAGARR